MSVRVVGHCSHGCAVIVASTVTKGVLGRRVEERAWCECLECSERMGFRRGVVYGIQ